MIHIVHALPGIYLHFTVTVLEDSLLRLTEEDIEHILLLI